MNALATVDQDRDAHAIMERVITTGDLKLLTPEERSVYYGHVCRSVGLNPLTRPFEYLTLNGKLVLYARRDCADQLRKINSVSLKITSRSTVGDLFLVEVEAQDKGGRTDSDMGAVSVKGLNGEALANAMLKACTKAKRRVTLSICGLGFLDESELPDIPERQRQEWREPAARADGFDHLTGEVIEPRTYDLDGVPLTGPAWIDAAGKVARRLGNGELRAWWSAHADARRAIVEDEPTLRPIMQALIGEVRDRAAATSRAEERADPPSEELVGDEPELPMGGDPAAAHEMSRRLGA